MAFGGGTFTTTNKVIPGAYINFVSAEKASAALSDNGVVAMPLELEWGPQGSIFEVSGSDFIKKSAEIFGYSYGHEKMKNMRELFSGASELLAFRLGTGGAAASNAFATALHPGTRGNDIVIAIEQSVDDESSYIVITKVDGTEWDRQTVTAASELKPNAWVTFKTSASLSVTSGTALTGGTNGTVAGSDYQTFLDQAESYSFNILASDATDASTKKLFGAYNRRMRDEAGAKFQTVLYKFADADYYGAISVENTVSDAGAKESAAVYWVAGAEAGCPLNGSLANTVYNGEYIIIADYTQKQLAQAIETGKFIFHRAGKEIRVLEDINTQVTMSDTIGDEFRYNQTVRVMDKVANTTAAVFNNKYSGRFNNDPVGRNALRNDIVKILDELAALGAIEEYDPGDIVIAQGENKRDVIVTMSITVSGAMSKLYMTVHVG